MNPIFRLLDRLDHLLHERGLCLALLAATTATVGSLYLSEIRDLVPCRLCWFQRIFMYPIAYVLAAGLLLRVRRLPQLVLPASVVGGAIAAYHVLLQQGYFSDSKACASGVPCSAMYIQWLGFITIPVLALVAFAIIALATSAVLGTWPEAAGQDEHEPAPWRAVVVTVLLAPVTWFVLALLLDR